MSPRASQSRDFKEMFKKATQKDNDFASKVLESLYKKEHDVFATINGFKSEAERIVKEFLESDTVCALDEVLKSYLSLRASKLLDELDKAFQDARKSYDTEFDGVDFSTQKYKAELFKADPFGEKFKTVNRVIDACQKRIDGLRENLTALVTKRELARIRFIKRKAEELIDKVLNTETDSMGIYHDLYTNGVAWIRFLDKSFEKIYIEFTPCFKGKSISIYDPKKKEQTPFVVCSNIKQYTKELKEKYGNCVIETVGKCDFYEDLFLMLKSFLKHVQIKKHIYLTEEELNGDSITTCEITYSCVIELRI